MRKKVFSLMKRQCHSISASEYTEVKPFSLVPGPKSFPIVGTAWKYFPFVGNYGNKNLFEMANLKLLEYGTLVKEDLGGECFLNVFEPEDFARVYKAEGKYPSRRSHLALEHYRLSKPDTYNNGGLLPTNGPEWWRLRSAFQKSLSRIQDVRLFLPIADEITSEFLSEYLGNETVIDNALPLLSHLNLELTWAALFGERLFGFQKSQLVEDSVPSLLIKAAESVTGSILETDSTVFLWKKFKTPVFKKIERNISFIEKIVKSAINNLKKSIETDKQASRRKGLIEEYLDRPDVDIKDIYGVAVDLILGGIDTTSYSSCFALYHLGVNKEKQAKLRSESYQLLSSGNSPITNTILNSASYTRAVLKEVFRLNPISVGISRITQEDTVLSGYFVPKGTVVLTQNMTACRMEKHFTHAEKFIPERWMRGSEYYKAVSPFLVLPFSHGARTCIARRLAEQNLLALILRVSRNYDFDWMGGTLGIQTPLINKPDKPIKLNFKAISQV